MKWKNVIFLVGLAVVSFLIFVFHYGFTWQDLASLSFYENLANPSVRIVRVSEGLRKEEVAEVVGDKLGWDETQKNQFMNSATSAKRPGPDLHRCTRFCRPLPNYSVTRPINA